MLVQSGKWVIGCIQSKTEDEIMVKVDTSGQEKNQEIKMSMDLEHLAPLQTKSNNSKVKQMKFFEFYKKEAPISSCNG